MTTTALDTIDLTRDEASALTARIRERVQDLWPLIVEAYQRRAWVALGYESWDGYCDAELRGIRPALGRGERQEMVAALRSAGMSTRAIGSTLGIGVGTVHRDLAGVPDGTPEAPVTGTDGKSYAPTQPPRPEPEPPATEMGPDEDDGPEDQVPETDAPADPDPLPPYIAAEIERRVAAKQTTSPVAQFLAEPDPEMERLTLRNNFLSAKARAREITKFDPKAVALVLEGETEWNDIGWLRDAIYGWFEQVQQARPARGLRLVSGG